MACDALGMLSLGAKALAGRRCILLRLLLSYFFVKKGFSANFFPALFMVGSPCWVSKGLALWWGVGQSPAKTLKAPIFGVPSTGNTPACGWVFAAGWAIFHALKPSTRAKAASSTERGRGCPGAQWRRKKRWPVLPSQAASSGCVWGVMLAATATSSSSGVCTCSRAEAGRTGRVALPAALSTALAVVL